MDITQMVAALAVGALFIFWHSQRKFKDKVLCIMHTQQGMRLELWAPLQARHITYGNTKKGDAGIYYLMPSCSCNTWWNKGVNAFFPALVKTWEFWWFHPYPQDPMAVQRYDPNCDCPVCGKIGIGALKPAISWHTPESRNAAWQERGVRAFAAATQQATGGKSAGLNTIQKVSILAGLGIAIVALLLILSDKGMLPI